MASERAPMAPDHSKRRNTQEVSPHMRCAQVSKESTPSVECVALRVLIANGANVGRTIARTIPAGRTSCPGRPRTRSVPSSAPCARATGFPLDDLTFIVTHFLPHLNRDAVYRILKAEGLGRLPPAQPHKR